MDDIPLVIDFGTGAAKEDVPKFWSSEQGGKQAAAFASLLKIRNPAKKPLAELRPFWASFRLMGTLSLKFTVDTDETAKELRKVAVKNYVAQPFCEDCPWSKDGHPAQGGLAQIVPVAAMIQALRHNAAAPIVDVLFDEEHDLPKLWQWRWLELAKQMNEPGGTWGAPLMLARIPRSSIAIASKTISFTVQLYVSRLLFYLIADDALADLMKPLSPPGTVVGTESLQNFEDHPIFSQGQTRVSPFSVAGIMCNSEHTGYAQAQQPLGIALPMKPYQLQTLQWMIDQEKLTRGLNGCFWEIRSWGGTGKGSEEEAPTKKKVKMSTVQFSNNEQEFYLSVELGEFRLEKPPLVRGGLLCEEMGLGKTLELVALIKATQNSAPSQPLVQPKLEGTVASNATLVVVPDTLIFQWIQEIKKSCMEGAELKVYTYLAQESKDDTPEDRRRSQARRHKHQTGDLTDFVDCDICLTTFRMVETERVLQKIMWRRIVIDEMQMIRSSTTKVAQMCENLSGHARWMVSGTPLYQSIKDLNGLLNFLQVIPFSLSDSKDGFWHQRLGAPLFDNDPGALELLHFLLRCIMIRHSKAQRYLTGPLAGRSILELPPIHTQYVGLQFSKYAEDAAYCSMEALGLRAAQAQVNLTQGQRQDRPAVVAIDALRTLAVSPTLLTGGLGVTGDLAKLARLWRALIPIQFDALAHIPGQPYPGAGKESLFANPMAMPGEKVRDYFLTRTANNEQKKLLEQTDIAQRLDQAQEDVKRNKLTLTFEKAGSLEGLPWRRWKWVLRCISSGRYHLVQLCRIDSSKRATLKTQGGEMTRLARECPILFRRCMQAFGHLRKYVKAETTYAQYMRSVLRMEPEDYLEQLELPYTERKTVHAEATEGFSETHEELWFQTKNLDGLPDKPPTLEELVERSTAANKVRRKEAQEEQRRRLRDRRDRARGLNRRERGGDDLEDDEDDDDEEEKEEESIEDEEDDPTEISFPLASKAVPRVAPKWLAKQRELKEIRTRSKIEQEEKEQSMFPADKFDFLAHEAFWRDAMSKLILKRHRRVVAELKLSWETMIHPGRDDFSIAQMIHCVKMHADLCFEAVFWFSQTTLRGDKYKRFWFQVDGLPEPLPSDSTCAKVKFMDGQERIVDRTEVRIARLEWFTSPMAEATENDSALTLKDALTQLQLKTFEGSFMDFLNQTSSLELALGLTDEELFARLQHPKDVEQLASAQSSTNPKDAARAKKLRETVRGRVDRFRTATFLRETRLIRRELFIKSKEIYPALKKVAGPDNSSISFVNACKLAAELCVGTYEDRVWGHLWNLHHGDVNGESLDWITVAFGLKGSNPIEVPAKEFISPKLQKLMVDDIVNIRMTCEDGFGSMGAGWFKARLRKEPAMDNINVTPRWVVEIGLNDGRVIKRSVNAEDIHEDETAKREKRAGKKGKGKDDDDYKEAGSKKKKKKVVEDEEEDENEAEPKPLSKKRRKVQQQEVDEEDEEEEPERWSKKKKKKRTEDEMPPVGSKKNQLGQGENETQKKEEPLDTPKALPNGLFRVKLLVNAHHGTITARQRIQLLIVDIAASKAALPGLERFETLLIKAVERGGSAGAQLASQHGFQALQQLIEPDPHVDSPRCAICDDDLATKGPVVLGCLHIFCRECLLALKTVHDSSAQYHGKPLPCPLCRREINPEEMFLVLPPEKKKKEKVATTTTTTTTTQQEEPDGLNANDPPKWTPALKDDEVNQKFGQLPDELQQWDMLSSRFVGLPRTFQTFLRVAAGVDQLGCPSTTMPSTLSTKISRVIDDIRAVQGKVVVFSQFARAVTMMMTVLKREMIPAVKVARGDRVEHLRAAIEAFTTDPNVKVFVIHSGSGAAGLTLTVAQHVFLLEPFLRAGEEAQAINRVHRIGQFQEVEARCYYMRGSVEERILAWRRAAPEVRVERSVDPVRDSADGEDEEESGLAVLASDDPAKSVASFSNAFLSYVLGASEATS